MKRLATHKYRSDQQTQAFLLVMICTVLLYAFRLGTPGLGGSEAYSAIAASQNSLTAVVERALRFDPGKPPLYQILLHWFAGVFGSSETALRALSVVFALVAAVLLYILALDMFAVEAALAALTVWVFNPLVFILAQWARMYAMFICVVIGSMLTFWRLREQNNGKRMAAAAICCTLMLYTHLCGLLFAAAEVSVTMRDWYRRRSVSAVWAGLIIPALVFVPFVPTAIAQSRGMMFTHWLDWIGAAHPVTPWVRTLTCAVALLTIVALVFGPSWERDEREPIRFCALWLLIPLIAFATVSMTVRPVFSVRYAAPAAPALALIAGRILGAFTARLRNLSAAGIAVIFVVLCAFYSAGRYEPWRDVARLVRSSGDVQQPVFFESGLVVSSGAANTIAGFDAGFPQGYFRAAFDYYFDGANPRAVIDPSNPGDAQEKIAEAAKRAGGAWLISGKPDLIARAELPGPPQFSTTELLSRDHATLYHIIPRTYR